MKTLKLCCALVLTVGLGMVSFNARADFTPTGNPVPLQQLLEGGSLTSCDKVFTNWTFSATHGPSSLTFSIVPGYDEFGPGFRILSDELNANTSQFKDVLIGYKVTSNGPRITDIHLRFASQLAGNGHTSVVEQATNGNNQVVGQITVFNPPPVLEETLFLTNPQSLLFVTKDIFLIGGNSSNPGASTITFVDQTFSQEGTINCNITGPDSVCGGTSNHQFSGPAGASTYSWSITGNGVIDGATNGQTISVTAGASGSFTAHLTVLNGACQSSTCEKTATIVENPVCEISGNPPPCATTSTEHTAPAGMTLYAWSITGDATITGATHQQTVTVQPTNNCSGSYTLFLTISNGCSATCNKTFNYGDTEKPVITNCPQGTDLGCNPETLPTCDSVKALVGASDNCGTPTLQCLPASSINGCNVELSFTIRAVDACGNESDPCIVTYTYKMDTEKPVITNCPQGSDLGCNPTALPDCDSVKLLVTASDNCGTPTLTCTSEDLEDGCLRIRVFTVTAVDGCNRESDPCIVRYTWTSDTTKPTIDVCPEGSDLGCNPSTLPDCDSVKAQAQASDHCGGATLTCSSQDSQEGCGVTRTFTLKAVDGCNNESDPCIVIYTWSTTTGGGIAIECPPEITVNRLADIPECNVGAVTVLNNCGTPTVECEKGPLVGTACNGSVTFTYKASDDCGTATCTRVVRITQEVPCGIDGRDSICETGSNSCTTYTGPDDSSTYTYAWSISGNGFISGGTTTQTVYVCPNGAGSFTLTLTVTTEDGCSKTCTKTVAVGRGPNCSISGSGSVCAGNKTEFCAPSGFTYIWHGPEQNGATSQCITVGTAGSYSVTIADGNGCVSTCHKSLTVKPSFCETSSFTFNGSSALSGTAGNVRMFTVNGVSVKVTAFSRTKDTGAWSTAYLGLYGGGLGVTDGSEGDGSSNRHTVDNIGRDNYVLFEFSEPVIISRACVGFVVSDSDMSVWIGAFADPYNNHLNLSDAVLGAFAHSETNLTDSSSTRCADLNAGEVIGNAMVIAAWTGDTSPEDQFKINKVVFCKPACEPPCVKPPCSITGKDPVCPNSGVNKYHGPSGSFTYSWTIMGNGNIVGPTNQQTVSVNAGNAGSYTLKLVTSNGDNCSTNCEKKVTVTAPFCQEGTFTFNGSSALSGTAGNVRMFTVNGVSVKVTAFSRTKGGGGTWAAAYLGLYGGGLGVTDGSEGDGSSNRHTVDNIGRDNYVLFEFSEPVIISRACVGFVVSDSDMSVWIGAFADPYNNHLNLSDAVLGAFAHSETNLTDSSSTRCADLNAGEVIGNAMVIAAWTGDTSPEDQFKINKVVFCKPACEPPCVKPSFNLTAPTTLPVCGSTGNKLVGPSGYPSYKWTVSGSGWQITAGSNSQTVTYTAGTGTGTFQLCIQSGENCETCKSVSFGCRARYTGCTPGFWKNHPELWNGVSPDLPGITYKTTDTFNAVFGVTAAQSGFSDSKTLLYVLGTGGGCKEALGRHAVAALLNTKANNYPLTTAQVLSQVKTALLTNNCTTIDALKNTLDAYNNLEGGVCDNPPIKCNCYCH